MTHGKMKIIDGDDPKAKPVWMYAWHTAITSYTFNALIRLPFLIHDAAKHVNATDYQEQPYEGRQGLVPYYYAHHRDFFMGGCMSTGHDDKPRPPADREKVLDTWRSLAMFNLEFSPVSLANYVAWMAFNWWHVVRGPEDMSYPKGAAVAILETVEGGSAFDIAFDPKYFDETNNDAPGEYENLATELAKTIDKHNARLANPDARITMELPGERGQRIRVPLIAILQDLVIQDVLAYNAKQAKKTAKTKPATKKPGKGKRKR